MGGVVGLRGPYTRRCGSDARWGLGRLSISSGPVDFLAVEVGE